MSMDSTFYFEVLYPLQDRVLQALNEIETGFYLSGGTAASRGYLNHRFSDDLDLFVDDDDRFPLWAARVIQSLSRPNRWRVQVLLQEERFVRLVLYEDQMQLKVELINDVPAHVGEIRQHPVLGRLDSAENILANKITALIDREEPKDLADIWGFCCLMNLPLAKALTEAQSKAAGIFPVDLARVLLSVTRSDWEQIRWVDAPAAEQFIADLYKLGETQILVRDD